MSMQTNGNGRIYYKLPQWVIIVEKIDIEIAAHIVHIVFSDMLIFFFITIQMYYFYNNKKTNHSFLGN